jgi:sugar phosphate isomerase/epimerase
MNIGLDSYCFHRYFGEIYEGLQTDPGTRWRMEGEFLDFALEQDVGEIALEACFFDMRIVAASMNYAKAPREELIGRVIPMLREAARAAEDQGVMLATENHIDFTSRELLRIIETVGSDHLRVNFDTGNCLRLFEDPVGAAARLAPYTISTHTKDIATRRKGGSPSENFTWWPACPAGEGVIDMPGAVKALKDGGFDGSLALEVDLIGEQWASLPEEEIVTRSLDYLRSLLTV